MPDTIHIQSLRLPTQIGVPGTERAHWQSLSADITLTPTQNFQGITDDITATIDYAAVADTVRALAASHPRKLIETLANEIAAALLKSYPLDSVDITLKKFILPDCDHVAVQITRP